jgi:hypothetical protein
MGTRIVHVSDISGREGTQEELGRLVIHQHPEFQQVPVTLDVLPEEIKELEPATQLVVLEYFAPGSHRGQRLTVTLDDFDRLAPEGVEMKAIVFQALIDQQAERSGKAATVASTRSATTAPARSRRARVDYATLEHAGEPHRGRITETEKRLVRENLGEINRRLREQGLRQVDPGDRAMKERYGL